MERIYLDFEKPVAELERKIHELAVLVKDKSHDDTSIEEELVRLSQKSRKQLEAIYKKLDPWQKTLVARHPQRPHMKQILAELFDDFLELAGDRNFGEDAAILGGMARFRGQSVIVFGHEKGHDTESRVKHNFGMAKPEGYRKAIRLMDLAEKYRLPVLVFVDTPGAYPGIEAEERGQGEAIARSIERCLSLKTPLVTAIVGEGASGGAVAIAASNQVVMLEYAIYSVISPEGAASILYHDESKNKELASALKITAQDMLQLGVIDHIVDEPLGGAHREPVQAIRKLGDAMENALVDIRKMSGEALKQQRTEKFLKITRDLP